MFLGIPVVVGVPARAATDERLRFAALRAAEASLNVYDFTDDDHADPDADEYAEVVLPEGMHTQSGHAYAIKSLCEKYPLETAQIAVFDLWIGNEDRALNFKAELSNQDRGVIFALIRIVSAGVSPRIDESRLPGARRSADFPSLPEAGQRPLLRVRADHVHAGLGDPLCDDL